MQQIVSIRSFNVSKPHFEGRFGLKKVMIGQKRQHCVSARKKLASLAHDLNNAKDSPVYKMDPVLNNSIL